jgi:hypothetical protein
VVIFPTKPYRSWGFEQFSLPKVLVPIPYVCELSWLDTFLHIRQRHPQSKKSGFKLKKYKQSTPATATFLALPRRRQTASPAADSS